VSMITNNLIQNKNHKAFQYQLVTFWKNLITMGLC